MLTVKYREMLAIACAEKSYGEFRFFFRIGRMGLVCNALRICFSNRSREVWLLGGYVFDSAELVIRIVFLESDICGAGFGFGCPFVCFC